MYDKLLHLMKQYSPMSETEIEFVKEHFPIQEFDRNEVFFQEGSIADAIYFVLEGCVRLFYNVDGNEKTAYFYTEGKFLCANESFIKNTPARENFQTLEETKLLVFPKSFDIEIFKKFPNFEMIERYALLDELVTSNRMVESFVSKSPQERYLELLDRNMDLFQRVPQHYIASYLGISPESLSRIRKRLKEK